MNLSTFFGIRNPVLNFPNISTNRVLISYKPLSYEKAYHIMIVFVFIFCVDFNKMLGLVVLEQYGTSKIMAMVYHFDVISSFHRAFCYLTSIFESMPVVWFEYFMETCI